MPDNPRTSSTRGQRRIHASFTPEEADDILADLPGGHGVSEATRRFLKLLIDARRWQPPPEPLVLPGLDDGVLYAPAQSVRPAPEVDPQMGWIFRKQDPTGISGVGVIGCYFVSPDGAATFRWFGGPPQNQPKWESYDNPGTDPFEQISGHTGRTVLIPIRMDPDPQ